MKNHTLRAFYKGTCFPLILKNLSEGEWKACCKNWDDFIVDTMKDGISLQDIGDYATRQMDGFAKWLNDIQKEHPEWKTHPERNELERLCQTQFGMDLKKVQVLWYGDVYTLLKLKRIQDDDMNGWLGMTVW
jgi:hypothetical protein